MNGNTVTASRRTLQCINLVMILEEHIANIFNSNMDGIFYEKEMRNLK